jgi:sulfur-carrier protein
MVELYLPRSLADMFPGAPRHLALEVATVRELLLALDRRWPGMWDRVCEAGPAVREHINVFVNGEKSTLETVLLPGTIVRIIPAISGG